LKIALKNTVLAFFCKIY